MPLAAYTGTLFGFGERICAPMVVDFCIHSQGLAASRTCEHVNFQSSIHASNNQIVHSLADHVAKCVVSFSSLFTVNRVALVTLVSTSYTNLTIPTRLRNTKVV